MILSTHEKIKTLHLQISFSIHGKVHFVRVVSNANLSYMIEDKWCITYVLDCVTVTLFLMVLSELSQAMSCFFCTSKKLLKCHAWDMRH